MSEPLLSKNEPLQLCHCVPGGGEHWCYRPCETKRNEPGDDGCHCWDSPRDDAVHHPQQYTRGKIECLDFILDQDFPFLAAQVCKYLVRYRWKGKPVEDLQKARFYLDRLIAEEGK